MKSLSEIDSSLKKCNLIQNCFSEKYYHTINKIKGLFIKSDSELYIKAQV